MIRRYLVMLENGPGKSRVANLSGFVPDVPGCRSSGKTLEELRANLHSLLELHFERLATSGQPMPEPIMGMDDVLAGWVGEWMVVKDPVTKSAMLRKTAKKISGGSEWDLFLKSSVDSLRGRLRLI